MMVMIVMMMIAMIYAAIFTGCLLATVLILSLIHI